MRGACLLLLVLLTVSVSEAKRIQKRTVYVTKDSEPDQPQAFKRFKARYTQQQPHQPSDYETCKQRCQKIRDQKEMEDYVAQLREEISLMEKRVEEEQKQLQKEHDELESELNDEGVLTKTAKAAKRMVTNAVHTVTGADEHHDPNKPKPYRLVPPKDVNVNGHPHR